MSEPTISELRLLVLDLIVKVKSLESQQAQNGFVTGDIAWMLSATALVFFMTVPGLTLYYAGMASQKKNLMTIAMQSFSICCLITLVWMFFGYSLSFTKGSAVIGGASRFFLIDMHSNEGQEKAPTIPETLFCVYQLGFAVVAAAIMSGASADRMKFGSMLLLVALWHLLVYCPVAHSNWHSDGFLSQVGILDWAGGNVVHITAGVSGLVTSIFIGKRRGFGEQKFIPNNTLHTIAGACFLWVGWLGFNGGSSYAANEQAAAAVLNTQIAASTAAFSWILTEYVINRQPTVLGMLNGCIAGLVSITPGAGYVDATGSFCIGLLSGPVCYYGITLKKTLGFDDALDAFGLHGIAGVYGGFMTGLFASSFGTRGAIYGNPVQLGLQMYGVVVSVLWSTIMTAAILAFVTRTIGLRVSAEVERCGLDRSSHGEGLYAERSKAITPSERVAELLKSYAIAKAKSSEEAALHNGNLPVEVVASRGTTVKFFREGPVSDDSSLTHSEVEETRSIPEGTKHLPHASHNVIDEVPASRDARPQTNPWNQGKEQDEEDICRVSSRIDQTLGAQKNRFTPLNPP